MTHRVYIIENPSGKRYIGLSEDVEHRLHQHNDGDSRYTSGKGPWKLVWTSKPLQLGEARRLEMKMKRQKGGSGLQVLMDAFGS